MRIEGQSTAINTTLNSGADVLRKLNPGDVIRAQVLENSDGELQLKLSDGSQVTAKSLVQMEAAEGEFINFVFRGISDGKLILERFLPTVQQTQIDPLLENIRNMLASLKLPVTDQNISLAMALKNQNLQITPENMAKMIELTTGNPEIKPDAAAFLTASKMAGNTNNIEQLQNLLAGRLKISDDISQLVKLIEDYNNGTKAGTSNVTESPTASASPINKSAPETAPSAVIDQDSQVNTTDGRAGKAAGDVTNSDISKLASALLEAAAEKTASVRAKTGEAAANNLSSITEASTIVTAETVEVQVKETAVKDGGSAPNTLNGLSKNDSSTIASQLAVFVKSGKPLDKADIPLLNALSTKLQEMISKGDLSKEQLAGAKVIAKEIADIALRLKEDDNYPADHGRENGLKDFEAAVDKLKNLNIKIDQYSDEIDPVKLYEDMNKAISAIKESMNQLPAGIRETAMNIVSNLESNINFINQLNNYSSYVQLPLSMFSQNTTGELYMLKRGSKAKKLDPSNLTVLISLDGNHIGRIDTLLSIDKKNISTNFRLENSEVFQILKDNHKTLYNSLLEKGYRLVDFTYRLMDEPINIINFEAEAKKQFIKSPNTIDLTV